MRHCKLMLLSVFYIVMFFLLNLSAVAVETEISRCPFTADCYFWVLFFKMQLRANSDTEILCIEKQMCRLTTACTEWLSHGLWKCQLLLITMLGFTIFASYSIFVWSTFNVYLFHAASAFIPPPDCGLQSEAAVLGLISLSQSSSVRLKATKPQGSRAAAACSA